MNTYTEDDDGYFTERPEREDPDLSKDDYLNDLFNNHINSDPKPLP